MQVYFMIKNSPTLKYFLQINLAINFQQWQVLCQKRYIFACRNAHVANKWVVYLIQGAIHANYIENLLKQDITADISQTCFEQTLDV